MKIIETDVFSEDLIRTVKLTIRLPRKIDKFTNVLYIHDGGSAFSDKYSKTYGGWDFHGALSNLESIGKIDNTVCIAFDAAIENDRLERLREYSPWNNDTLLKERKLDKDYSNIYPDSILYGKGKQHLNFIKFLLNEVEPKYIKNVDRNKRYVIGSSMGGFMSLVTLYKLNKYFSKAICLSPAFWYAQKELEEMIIKQEISSSFVYIDVGTKEGEEDEIVNQKYLNCSMEIKDLLISNNVNTKFEVFPFATHSPPAWRSRLPKIIGTVL